MDVRAVTIAVMVVSMPLVGAMQERRTQPVTQQRSDVLVDATGASIRLPGTTGIRSFREMSSRTILESLAAQAGVALRFSPDADADTCLSFAVRDLNVADVFRVVLAKANLAATIIDEKTLLIAIRR